MLETGRYEDEKRQALIRAASGASGEVYKASTAEFERIPGYPIAYWISQTVADAFLEDKLSSVGSTRRGLQTGNKDHFIRQWSEVNSVNTDLSSNNRVEALQCFAKWFRFNNGGDYRKWAGGIDLVVNWQSDGRDIKASGRAIIPSEDLYFKEAVCWGRISSGPEAYRLHERGLLPGDLSPCYFSDDPYFSLAYFNSPVARTFKNVVNPTITNTVGDNWLLDVQLASAVFKADQAAIWLAELGLPLQFENVVRGHIEFFRAKTRVDALKRLMQASDTQTQMRLRMLAVCAGAEGGLDTVIEALLGGLAVGKDDALRLVERSGLTDFLWTQVSQAYGYKSEAPDFEDFAIALFQSAYARALGEDRLQDHRKHSVRTAEG